MQRIWTCKAGCTLHVDKSQMRIMSKNHKWETDRDGDKDSENGGGSCLKSFVLAELVGEDCDK